MNYAWNHYKLLIKNALAYRENFIILTTSMFVNNVLWVLFWWLIFQRFETFGTWSFDDMLTLYSVIYVAYGLHSLTTANVNNIAQNIEEGQLDTYLSRPQNVLLQASLGIREENLGDLAIGVLIALYIVPFHLLPLWAVFVVTSAVLLYASFVCFASIAFFTGRFKDGFRVAKQMFTIFSNFPFGGFTGWTRAFLIFIFPVGLVAGIPAELLTAFNTAMFLTYIGVTVVVALLAYTLFYTGLQRYESGNLVKSQT